MNNDKPHFLARKIQDFQKSSSSYVCPLCKESPKFSSESRLFEHGKALHAHTLGGVRESQAWQDYIANATSHAKRKHPRGLGPAPAPASGLSKPSSDESMRPNVGDDAKPPARPGRPTSTPVPLRSSDKRIEDLTKLTLNSGPDVIPARTSADHRTPSPPSKSLKRAAVGEAGLSDQATDQGELHVLPRNRRPKTLSGGTYLPKDPEFDREAAVVRDPTVAHEPSEPQKRLFDPNTDKTTFGSKPRKLGKADAPLGSRRVYDARSHFFHSNKDPTGHIGYNSKAPSRPPQAGFIVNTGLPTEQASYQDGLGDPPDSDNELEHEPELLLQPETRPISHE
ncbi:hypothetical protein MMC11_009034, partial [Xylographa trunciseda]|nr:hypothetical protein [Xylographa trunciseda]